MKIYALPFSDDCHFQTITWQCSLKGKGQALENKKLGT